MSAFRAILFKVELISNFTGGFFLGVIKKNQTKIDHYCN